MAVKKIRRRVKGNFNMHRTFRMRTTHSRRFDAHCDRVGISKSELLRRLVTALPTRRNPKKVVSVRVV